MCVWGVRGACVCVRRRRCVCGGEGALCVLCVVDCFIDL